MGQIQRKKKVYPVSESLMAYLVKHERSFDLPISYDDLRDFTESFSLIDRKGRDTLWEVMVYTPERFAQLNADLVRTYAMLKTGGDFSVMEHLVVDRIDYCTFGNTFPFRIRIINKFNDNYDYFYVKRADASRIYGLDLEELLSPDSINFLVHKDTLIEEHIIGIPGNDFIKQNLTRPEVNRVRLAKEFVKFNERCFVRLLGDMRSYNYVIRVTPDFEDEQYRVRSIDFDQQSYEGRKTVYLPQYFKDNNEVVKLCTGLLNYETALQYQAEERTLIARRAHSQPVRLKHLLTCMKEEPLSSREKIVQLREELGEHHGSAKFGNCKTMGDLLEIHLSLLLKYP